MLWVQCWNMHAARQRLLQQGFGSCASVPFLFAIASSRPVHQSPLPRQNRRAPREREGGRGERQSQIPILTRRRPTALRTRRGMTPSRQMTGLANLESAGAWLPQSFRKILSGTSAGQNFRQILSETSAGQNFRKILPGAIVKRATEWHGAVQTLYI